MVYYLIMGSVPDGHGYLEWIEVPDPFQNESDTAVPSAAPDGQSSYNFFYVVHDGGTDLSAIDWNTAKGFP